MCFFQNPSSLQRGADSRSRTAQKMKVEHFCGLLITRGSLHRWVLFWDQLRTSCVGLPLLFLMGSWSGSGSSSRVTISSSSSSQQSSVDISTTVSVIMSGRMAAWRNSGVATQGGIKASKGEETGRIRTVKTTLFSLAKIACVKDSFYLIV